MAQLSFQRGKIGEGQKFNFVEMYADDALCGARPTIHIEFLLEGSA